MNYLKLLGACLSFCFCYTTLCAQDKHPLLNERDLHRPKLFTALPERINVEVPQLDKLLGHGLPEAGRAIDLPLAENMLSPFAGTIISSVSKYENTIHSVVIRCSNYPGATLTLSSSIQADGTVQYSGRIISFKNADCFELKKINNQYIFIKKDFYDLVNE